MGSPLQQQLPQGNTHPDTTHFELADAVSEDARLRQVIVYAGAHINGVSLVYEQADGTRVTTPSHYGHHDRPQAHVFDLVAHEHIVAISFSSSTWIRHLTIELDSGRTQSFGTKQGGRVIRMTANAGDEIISFCGGIGGHLHNLGVFTRRIPSSDVAAPEDLAAAAGAAAAASAAAVAAGPELPRPDEPHFLAAPVLRRVSSTDIVQFWSSAVHILPEYALTLANVCVPRRFMNNSLLDKVFECLRVDLAQRPFPPRWTFADQARAMIQAAYGLRSPDECTYQRCSLDHITLLPCLQQWHDGLPAVQWRGPLVMATMRLMLDDFAAPARPHRTSEQDLATFLSTVAKSGDQCEACAREVEGSRLNEQRERERERESMRGYLLGSFYGLFLRLCADAKFPVLYMLQARKMDTFQQVMIKAGNLLKATPDLSVPQEDVEPGAPAAPSIAPVDAVLRATAHLGEFFEYWLDAFKGKSLHAAFLEPTKLYFDRIGDYVMRDDVDVHGINTYNAVLLATLGIQVPGGNFWEDEPKGMCEFLGVRDQAFQRALAAMQTKETFGQKHTAIKAALQGTPVYERGV
jgi:hypothetical protein